MNEMIQRMAKAMWALRSSIDIFSSDADYEEFWKAEFEALAKTALEAAREPTDAMIAACGNATAFCDDGITMEELRDQPKIAWQVMIDEALKP